MKRKEQKQEKQKNKKPAELAEIPKQTLVGKIVEVFHSTNQTEIGIKGKVVEDRANILVIDKGKFKIVKVRIGKLHECKAIKPRFVVRKKFYSKYMQRYLPSRNVGILIVSTNQGLMTHREAIEKGLGGVLIAYCF